MTASLSTGDEKFMKRSPNQDNMHNESISLSQAVSIATKTPYGIPKMSTETVRWMDTGVQSLIKYLGTDLDYLQLTTDHVGMWQKHLYDRKISPVTSNSYLRAIKTMYKNLMEDGHVEFNPADPISFLKEPAPKPRSILKKDYLKLRDLAPFLRDKAIIAALWATGCRISEIKCMDLEKMDYWTDDGKHCFAFEIVGKFSKQRWVYVKGEEAEILQSWIEKRPETEDSALFVTLQAEHKRLSRPALEHVLRRVRLKAKIPISRPTNAHAFRHAFAIRKLDEGYDLAVVSQWLGHAKPAFTAEVYAFRRETELRRKYFSSPGTTA